MVTGNTPSWEVERFIRGAVGRVLLRPEASEPGISGVRALPSGTLWALRPENGGYGDPGWPKNAESGLTDRVE